MCNKKIAWRQCRLYECDLTEKKTQNEIIGMEYRGAFGIAKDNQVFWFRKCHYHDIVEVEWDKWLILPTSESLDHVGAIIIARKIL